MDIQNLYDNLSDEQITELIKHTASNQPGIVADALNEMDIFNFEAINEGLNIGRISSALSSFSAKSNEDLATCIATINTDDLTKIIEHLIKSDKDIEWSELIREINYEKPVELELFADGEDHIGTNGLMEIQNHNDSLKFDLLLKMQKHLTIQQIEALVDNNHPDLHNKLM